MSILRKLKDFRIISELFSFLFIIVLFFFPLIKVFAPNFRKINEIHYMALAFSGGLGLLFLYFNIDRLKEEYKYNKSYFRKYILLPIVLFLVYMVWTLISTILAKNTTLAFDGTQTRKDGYKSYLLYAGCFGLSFCIYSEKFKKILLYLFPTITVFVLMLLDIRGIGFLQNYVFITQITTGPFWNSNHYGYYLLIATSISCFLFINEKNSINKLVWIILYMFILYHLIINNTFGSYLALALCLILYLIISFIKKEKKLFIIISILAFLLISFGTTQSARKIVNNNLNSFFKDIHSVILKIEGNSTKKDISEEEKKDDDSKFLKAGSSRMILWVLGIKAFLKNPIIGYGPENLVYKFIEAGVYSSYTAHNLIIQLLAVSGFPGFILFMSALRNYFDSYINKCW